MKRQRPNLGLIAGLTLALTGADAFGQAADLLRREGEAALEAGNQKTAIEKLEEFKRRFPADPNIWQARFHLARAYLLDAQHEKGIAELKDLARPISSPRPEQQETANYWIARGHHLKLEFLAQSGDNKARDAAFKETEQAFADFITAFPQPKTVDRNEMLYFRARCFELVEQFEKARADLEAARADLTARPMANRELTQNVFYGLAGLYLKQAKALARAGKTAEADALRASGRQIFEAIAKQAANVVMANEAHMRIGAILNEDREFDEAIRWLRRVRPKAEVLAVQRAITTSVQQRHNLARTSETEREFLTESKRLDRLMAEPDPLINAWLLIGAAYLEQRQFPEAMKMFRHLARFAEDQGQKQRIHHGILVAYIGLNQPDVAKAEFEKFQSEHGKPPLADGVSYFIGRLYLEQRPPRYEEARAQFEKSLSDYPNGRLSPNARLALATARSPQESQKILDELKRLEAQMAKSELADEYAFAIAETMMKDGRFADAAQKFREVKEKFPAFYRRAEAALRVGYCLQQAGRLDEAIAEYRKFITDFSDQKELIVEAHFLIALALETKKDYENALKEYAGIIQRGARADEAQYKTALLYFNKQDWPHATESFRAVIEKYPQSRLVSSAYFGIGTVQQALKDYAKAAEAFGTVAEKFPQDALATDSLFKVGEAWRAGALALGLPQGLLPDKLELWKQYAARAIASYEIVLVRFSDHPLADVALDNILGLQSLRERSGLGTAAEVEKYFRDLAAKFADNKALGIKLLVAQAKQQRDPARALALYTQAWAASEREKIPLGAASYEAYAKSLLAANPPQTDRALEVWQKMEATAADDESRAKALIGRGEILSSQRKFGEAERLFDRVLKEFAHTKTAGDATLGKAFLLEHQGKYDEAIKIYDQTIKTERGSRAARATFRAGHSYLAKKDEASAFNYFSRFDVFFSTFTDYAPEAAWHCGQILERQNKAADAQKYYQIIVRKYPNSPWAERARAQLPAAPAR